MPQNSIVPSLQAEIDKLTRELEQIELNRKQKKAELRQHRKALTALTGNVRQKKEVS